MVIAENPFSDAIGEGIKFSFIVWAE